MAAASNDYSSAYGGSFGTNLTSDPDSGTVGAPSTYPAALSVASVDGVKTPYMLYNDQVIYFTEASVSSADCEAIRLAFRKSAIAVMLRSGCSGM